MGTEEDDRIAVAPQRTRRRRLVVGVAAAAVVVVLGATTALLTLSGAGAPASPDAGQPPPDVEELAGELADQELEWGDCGFPAGDPAADVDVSNVECATVKVPKNWLDPVDGDTWDVRISRARNIDTADPEATTLLLHGGGPLPSLSFSATMQQRTP